jgi:hypothetical protein
MSFSRPSDEEILKYEQSIADNEVNCVPLVSEKVPLESLLQEYAGNNFFLGKLKVIRKFLL